MLSGALRLKNPKRCRRSDKAELCAALQITGSRFALDAGQGARHPGTAQLFSYNRNQPG
jgi:hypothetical protein